MTGSETPGGVAAVLGWRGVTFQNERDAVIWVVKKTYMTTCFRQTRGYLFSEMPAHWATHPVTHLFS